MIDWPPDDNEEDQAPALSAMLAELATADAPRRRELLAAISDLSWKMGPGGAAAIPALIDWPLGGDRETEDSVCYALSNCSPASIAPLLELLDHPSELARQRACYTLGLIGKNAGGRAVAVANGLLAKLDDPADAVRAKAAFALGFLADHRKTTLKRLMDTASIGSASSRASALHAIGNLGRNGVGEDLPPGPSRIAAATEAVLAALDEPDADVRRSACHALEALGLPADQHLERVLRIVESDPSNEVQARAASQLRELAQRADISGAAGRLARLLDCDRGPIFLPICETLGQIGPRARAAVPVLLNALDSTDDRIALEAAEALWCIEGRAETILPTLDRLFDDNGETVCDIVCAMGPEARPLLPKLLDALAQDDYWDLQWAAGDAIGRVASADPETLQALQRALSHESGIVRSSAAKALANIGAPAVPLLIDMLSAGTAPRTQEWVAESLAHMGPVALSAAPTLRAKLASPHRGLRLWAAIALGKVASDADAVPVLIEGLEDDGLADTWQPACEALPAIGAPAAASREHLVALTSCPVDEIRQAAELAIAAIDRPPS